ncbi:CheR family methyltransferase [Orenia marismortui]|uniref:protein-glutamate O-methyltransferase n=1 Tax=Orenia marismortui TaxID=46469 RepID=A0A4R8H382_9FIRM|nr:protein-glutamate O-methyltransferase CheR [Orenia marismortui]TDX53200.1 chemotaxis protein methyltransferase CheR [Orenia marismortui]
MLKEYCISDRTFRKISQLVYNSIGIKLKKNKKAMLKSRLIGRLIELDLDNFDQYYKFLINSKEEFDNLINFVTTNVTSFFREDHHFDYLISKVLPELEDDKDRKKIRVWSAGCSSGEEAYSIAIVLSEYFNDQEWDCKVLATDINKSVLSKASQGIYSKEEVKYLPKYIINKYFKSIKEGYFKVKESIREKIVFKKVNLKPGSYYPIKSKLDFIFCRNVFIYFDHQTRKKISNKFYKLLREGGYLFLGNSDTMFAIDSFDKKWRVANITTYQKLD